MKLEYVLIRLFVKLIVLFVAFILSMTVINAESEDDLLVEIGDNFAEALKFADAKMWVKAEDKTNKIKNNVTSDIVTWLRLRDGTKKFSEYESFLSENSEWPGIKLLREKGEQAIDASVSSIRIKNYFLESEPLTGHGALSLAEAYSAGREYERAEKTIIKSWLTHSFSETDFRRALDKFGELLEDYNKKRIDNLLWLGKLQDAQQMISLLDKSTVQLSETRIALQQQKYGVDALIRKLPASFKDSPALAFDRFRYRRKKGLIESAEKLLVRHSKKGKYLGRPEAWATGRDFFARAALQRGDPELAYEITSRHFIPIYDCEKVSELADLEWLAGFIAFEFLNESKKALSHFKNFAMCVVNPINKSRASYWIGRVYENLGQNERAKLAYNEGAKYQSYFYGQLAAERGKAIADQALLKRDQYEWEFASFTKKSSVKAAILLYYAGRSVLADRFFNHASEKMTKLERLQLSQLAYDIGLTASGVSLAKTAALSGISITDFAFPVIDKKQFLKEELAPLSTAIIRQESGFFNNVKSSAGAVGLMQLMPRTAESMARKLDLTYKPERLSTDSRYNITLGSSFLNILLKKFDGSKILAISAYNAGPNRVRKWMETYGDPRTKGTDPLVWIELIPFNETRNYVKRVIEADWIYQGKYGRKSLNLDRAKRSFGHKF